MRGSTSKLCLRSTATTRTTGTNSTLSSATAVLPLLQHDHQCPNCPILDTPTQPKERSIKIFTIATVTLSLRLGATACSAGGPSSEPATTLPPASSAPAEPNATVETPSETPTPEPAP